MGISHVLCNEYLELVFDDEKGMISVQNKEENACAVRDLNLMFDRFDLTQDHDSLALFTNKVQENAQFSVESKPYYDDLGEGRKLVIEKSSDNPYRPVYIVHIVVYDQLPVFTMQFGLTNHLKFPVRMKSVRVAGNIYPDSPVDNYKTLDGEGGFGRTSVRSDSTLVSQNNGMATFIADGRRHTAVAGGFTYTDFIKEVTFEKNDDNRVSFALRVYDPYGRIVPPGETYLAEDRVYFDFITSDPFIALEQYGIALRAINHASPNLYNFPTICGWLTSSWCGSGPDINNSEKLVEVAQKARECGFLKYTPVALRLEPDYYCYENYGDTQQGWWDNEHFARYGHLREPYETFEKFCKGLKGAGCIPFTYFQCNLPSNDFALEHPNFLIGNEASSINVNHDHHRPLVRFDYTDEEFQKHFLGVWKRLRKAGLQGVKLDYPETLWIAAGGFDDPCSTTASAYKKMFQLCREGLGEDAFIHERILGENDVPRTDLTVGVVDLQRTWADNAHLEPGMITICGLRWYKNRVVYIYYPDGKAFINQEQKPSMARHEHRAALTMLYVVSGRLELGNTIHMMPEDIRYDISRLYPIHATPKSARPVDMLITDDHPQVYVFDVDPDWVQLALYNSKESSQEIRVPLSGNQADMGSMGFDPLSSYYIYDFWNERFEGEYIGKDTFSANLQGGEALMYSVHKVCDHPQFLSTNRHLMQGYVDLRHVIWSQEEKMLKGVATAVVADEPFEIAVACNGYRPVRVESEGQGCFEVIDQNSDLIKIILRSSSEVELSWRLLFQ